jgi:hypothetical protein
MKGAALEGDQTFPHHFGTAIDKARLLSAILKGSARYSLNIQFIVLTKEPGVAVWNRSLFPHPRYSTGSIQPSRKRDTDSLPHWKRRKNI